MINRKRIYQIRKERYNTNLRKTSASPDKKTDESKDGMLGFPPLLLCP
jgi:hypothetical protein